MEQTRYNTKERRTKISSFIGNTVFHQKFKAKTNKLRSIKGIQ
jgi:hypothetical protein